MQNSLDADDSQFIPENILQANNSHDVVSFSTENSRSEGTADDFHDMNSISIGNWP